MKTQKLQLIISAGTLFLLLLFAGKITLGQESNSKQPKQITVTGSAEMSLDPTEVELAIVIHDRRTDIEKRESDLVEICRKHKISEDQLNFKGAIGSAYYWDYWYWWWWYRNATDITQTYKLKVDGKTNILELVKDLNKTWVQNITISSTTNKDIQTYRKEVKKEAMRMAKEKAAYLLEAIGEEVGSVISVEEVISDHKKTPEYDPYYRWYWGNPYYYGNSVNNSSNSNMNSNSVMSSSGGSNEQNSLEGLSKIKLRYEVKAVFEIK